MLKSEDRLLQHLSEILGYMKKGSVDKCIWLYRKFRFPPANGKHKSCHREIRSIQQVLVCLPSLFDILVRIHIPSLFKNCIIEAHMFSFCIVKFHWSLSFFVICEAPWVDVGTTALQNMLKDFSKELVRVVFQIFLWFCLLLLKNTWGFRNLFLFPFYLIRYWILSNSIDW